MNFMETSINERFERLIITLYRGNKSAFAQAIGVAPSVVDNIVGKRQGKPSFDVVEKISAIAGLNLEWLITGKGEMLRTSTPSQYGTANLMLSGHDNVQVQGNSNNVATQPHPPTQTIDRALDEIAEQRKLVQTAQAQIDRLLAVIERLTAPNN